ncbi:MAG: hypothetical protein AB1749_05125 [Pseudomonadota bacterium]
MRAALPLLAVLVLASGANAQQPPPDWQVDLSVPDPDRTRGGANTTIVPRMAEPAEPVPADMGQVRLVALLTADGQPIDRGVVWRVFEDHPADARQLPKIVGTYKEASPVLKLKPGAYIVNVAFGRAHLTRKISVTGGPTRKEPFVLNAGGLRLSALIGGKPAPANSVSFEIQTDERDQSGNRATVMSGVKPGLIIRLNAGIYHVVSAYGDANAVVRADVTVEAGKLTEATVAHSAAKVTLKLVTKSGGDALPDTQWVLQTPDGVIVKESVGALPTHYLAPGTYTAIAKSQGRAFRRDFSVENGAVTQVEVMMQ